jgi:hypothetical protein
MQHPLINARLQGLGLLEDTRAGLSGSRNAWRLTPRGEACHGREPSPQWESGMTPLGSPAHSTPMPHANRISLAECQAPISVVAVVLHEHDPNLTRTHVRFKASRPEVTKLTHKAAVKGALALAPSRAWFPGRRGTRPGRGAHPSFNPTNCAPIGRRA